MHFVGDADWFRFLDTNLFSPAENPLWASDHDDYDYDDYDPYHGEDYGILDPEGSPWDHDSDRDESDYGFSNMFDPAEESRWDHDCDDCYDHDCDSS